MIYFVKSVSGFTNGSLVWVLRCSKLWKYGIIPESVQFRHHLLPDLILSIEMPLGVQTTKSHHFLRVIPNTLNLIEIIVFMRKF